MLRSCYHFGPFDVSEPTRSQTGIVRVEQSATRSARGARPIFDGPVLCHFADGRVRAVTSAGLALTPSNARMFALRAYYCAAPRAAEETIE